METINEPVEVARRRTVAGARAFAAWVCHWLGTYERAADDLERATTYGQIAEAARELREAVPVADWEVAKMNPFGACLDLELVNLPDMRDAASFD